MPWKNGSGTTTELIVTPAGAALDAFRWRVSIAEVGTSGPFSAFPGCDRILVQTDGAPMTLTHAGHGAHPLELLRPHAFDGEWATEARLATVGADVGEGARDFNVITRRTEARAQVTVVRAGAEWGTVGAPSRVHFVHALRGATTVAGDGVTIALPTGESAVVNEAIALRVAACEGAVALVVAIETRDEM